MIVQNCYYYILIGLELRILVHANSRKTKESTEESIATLLSTLELCGFDVSLSGFNSTIFEEMQEDISELDEKSLLGVELAERVNDQFDVIEKIVFAEANSKKVYVLPNRRFNTKFLLSNPEKLIKDGMFNKLSDIAQNDIASSCKCLLFGVATASAFHILRATEAVLKDYYFIHRKQKRLKKPMWGPMVDQLRAKKRKRLPETILDSLDSIRKGYRNPTQHPEAIYDIDKAQDLFGVCLDAIGKMAEDL